MRLEGKSIIVTGSTTGIGKAIAKRCAQEGAQVLVHGLEADLAEETAAEIGEAAAVHVDDLLDEGTPARIIDAAIKAFGKIDCLVNNAGIVAAGTIEETDGDFFDRVMGINARAPLFLIQNALPHLRKTKGRVLNIGSVNAYSGEPNLVAYSMSKGAIMTMTRNLGDTLNREEGIVVNQINPGWILTENEIKRKQEHGLDADWYKKLPPIFAPSGRILYPEEIAEAAIYWLSDAAGPVSAQVVEIAQIPFIGRNLPKN